MFKVNEPRMAGDYVTFDFSTRDYTSEGINKNASILEEIREFLNQDADFQKIGQLKKEIIDNELSYFIEQLKWNAEVMNVRDIKGDDEIISKYRITTVNLKSKITKEYKCIIRLFSTKIIMNNHLMNLGFVNQC